MSVEKQAHGLDQACPRVAHTPQTSDIFIQRLVQASTVPASSAARVRKCFRTDVMGATA